ncbi:MULTISPECIES: class I SAM-dependent methyltransferase [unclassified Marichromatium]|uniref:class I SAM-dependent methyltransferase n=1 Tax=unclassified Marichromatium TaxID=2618417 RepID=UPI000F3FE292|nr:SAM-dependent methyltransferase [Marichromatium sp. AB32]RNE93191.1 SAM-dependent methyltransferase [Marichromatium sp. AB32]
MHAPEETRHAQRISTALSARIDAEIAASADALLPFDRFMELALYAPGLGYYVAGAPKFGRGGDFITAPEYSPLFGQCLAAQCAEALARLGGGDVLEFGAGSGALASQVITQLAALDRLPERYLILEPSPDLQAAQRERLATLPAPLAARCHWLERLPEGFNGVVIGNEVLDAMPVHRFAIGAAGEVLEVFVTGEDGQFREVQAAARSPGLVEAVEALQAAGLARAPGYGSEINLRLGPWFAALDGALEHALVLLADYGYPRPLYYHPERDMGTLMCHHRHRAHDDPYRHPGLQDITAHVDFSAVAEAATRAGFGLAGFTTQAHFLIGCGIDTLLAAAPDPLDLAQQAKQLLLPDAMGERFKVIGLTRGLDGPWRGFGERDLGDRL